MNCRDFREIVDSYLADELLTETNHGVLRHLEECAACREEVESHRAIRARLAHAVKAEPEFEISPAFERSLRALLRNAQPEEGRWQRFLRMYGLRLAGAGLLLILTFGVLYSIRQTGDGTTSTGGDILLASALPAGHIVNVAASDHDNCAVKHFSEQPSKPLKDVSADHRELASVVNAGLSGVMKDCKLVDSHACGYGDRRFSHVVLRNGGKMVSVLVTEGGSDESVVRGKISRFATDKFAISRFDVRDRSVFVISQMDDDNNEKAAEAIASPLRTLFDKGSDRSGFRSALLFAR